MKIDIKGFSGDAGDKGNIRTVVFRDKIPECPMKSALYEIKGKAVEGSEISSQHEPSVNLETKRAHLRDAWRLNYIPSLRANYCEYGLDEEAEKVIQEATS